MNQGADPPPEGGRKVRLLLEYDGTGYAGWQLQANARTVQEVVEEAVRRVAERPVRVHGAGRTDAGVHALGQVAHFETASKLPCDAWKQALNALLPTDVAVRAVSDADASFHSRFSARGKTYLYAIRNHPDRSALDARFHWLVRFPLDEGAMKEAASFLIGRNDFRGFSSWEGDRNPERELRRLDIRREGESVTVVLEADSFLWKMARGIVGSLVEVGRGRHPAAWVRQVLEGRDRKAGGPSAPARGLFLVRVDYGEPPGSGDCRGLPPPGGRFSLAGP
jgi:tRNA pseudouridine38-40 synthase